MRRLKAALLAALSLTSLCLGALPWQLLPVSGVASALQFGVVFVVFLYVILRTDLGVVLEYSFNPYTLTLIAFGVVLYLFLHTSLAPEYGLVKASLFALRSVVPVIAFGMLAPYDVRET